MLDINDLAAPPADGFVYSIATGVNDDGVIVGIAAGPGFSLRPFALVPAED